MLTVAQCETVANLTNDAEIICPACADETDDEGYRPRVRPVIQYELDSEQSERWAGYELDEIWPADDEGETGHTDECVPALNCERCGTELLEEYHYGHESEDEDEDA